MQVNSKPFCEKSQIVDKLDNTPIDICPKANPLQSTRAKSDQSCILIQATLDKTQRLDDITCPKTDKTSKDNCPRSKNAQSKKRKSDRSPTRMISDDTCPNTNPLTSKKQKQSCIQVNATSNNVHPNIDTSCFNKKYEFSRMQKH